MLAEVASDTVHLASCVAVIFYLCTVVPEVSERWETSVLNARMVRSQMTGLKACQMFLFI